MHATRLGLLGSLVGFVIGARANQIAQMIIATAIAFAIFVLGKSLEGVVERRLGLLGGFLIVLVCGPMGSSFQGSMQSIARYFTLFLMAIVGLIVGNIAEESFFASTDDEESE